MPEEILTPGEGRIRVFITMAGNPVLSTPKPQRLTKALDSLEFMVSLDDAFGLDPAGLSLWKCRRTASHS